MDGGVVFFSFGGGGQGGAADVGEGQLGADAVVGGYSGLVLAGHFDRGQNNLCDRRG